MPDVITFAEIELEFHQRVRTVVLCNCATIDASGRPRLRVLHPLWEGATGWVTTRRSTPKTKQIAPNPFVSMAYIQDPFKPVYVECRAVLDDDLTTRQRIWELCRNTPELVGYDPAVVWGDITDPDKCVAATNTIRSSAILKRWMWSLSRTGDVRRLPDRFVC